MKNLVLPHEQYTLTLTHEFIDDEGECHTLDTPIVSKYIVDKAYGCVPTGVIVNDMIERLKNYILCS